MIEHELIKGCIRQEPVCQRMLFDKHAGKMMGVCLRYAQDNMEAEDMLQDAFIKVFQYIIQFKFEGSFEGWVRRIVVNTAIRHLERKKMSFKEIAAITSEPVNTLISRKRYAILHLRERLKDVYNELLN